MHAVAEISLHFMRSALPEVAHNLDIVARSIEWRDDYNDVWRVSEDMS